MSRFLWTKKQDVGPLARWSHAVAYDQKRERTVLFGGNDASTELRDTWEWDGRYWTQVSDIGPSADAPMRWRGTHNRKRVILFVRSGARAG